MANDLKTILGDHLAPASLFDPARPLPSPYQLRNKIVIMAYKYHNPQASGKDESESKQSAARKASTAMTLNASEPDLAASEYFDDDDGEPSNVQSGTGPGSRDGSRKSAEVARELSLLIHLDIAPNQHRLDAHWGPANMTSNVPETFLNDIAGSDPERPILYNQNRMTRVYPHGLRILSSNVNPIRSWRLGSQIVAMNVQQTDDPM